MKRFNSVHDGLAAMRDLVDTNAKKVGALLTFQKKNKKQGDYCFLFQSMDKAVSQIIKLYPNDLKITGVEKVDMEQAVHARNVVASVAALGVDNEFLGVESPGHAEEHLIRGFADAVREASDIANVIIYVSHSPCCTLDANPSSTLPGYPIGCANKLCRLAADNAGYGFSVVYWKKFGLLEGIPDGAAELNATAGKPNNLTFVEMLR